MKDQMKEAFTAMFDKLESWLKAFITLLPNILVALFVFFLTLFIARLSRRIIRKWLRRTPANESVSNLIGSIGTFIVIVAGIFLILAVLDLDGAATGLLAGASISGLVIGLALQNTFTNTFAGVVLSLRNDVRIGDWIESKGFAGEVQRITLRNTMILGADNNVVYIPNKEILENPLKNYSRTTRSCVELIYGVAYSSDLEVVREVALRTLSKEFAGLAEQDIDFYYTEFGDYAIRCTMRFGINAISVRELVEAKSKAIIILKRAFDREKIVLVHQLPPLNLKDSSGSATT